MRNCRANIDPDLIGGVPGPGNGIKEIQQILNHWQVYLASGWGMIQRRDKILLVSATLQGQNSSSCKEYHRWRREGRELGIERLDASKRDVWAAQEELFHGTLVESARNQMLSRIVEDKSVLARMFASLSEFDHEVTVETVEQVVETHGNLITAIEGGDAGGAREQMAAMLRHGCECVLGNQPYSAH